MLLVDSGSMFIDQNDKARLLMKMLRVRVPDRVMDDGFEATFNRLRPKMIADEVELFNLIRALTISSLHPVNSRMRAWLHDNIWARNPHDPTLRSLALQLNQLQHHLDGWLAKYDATVAVDENSSIVYMADEKHHGRGFPSALSGVLAATIAGTCLQR